ncbi:MAG: zinc metallopeptidase [Coriobacteriales bacterium]|nr:zinc metallopeptidase [Coriobacteriales bacterium]MDO5709502.1 zinc metallopeptidase [Coriobacteriales bacterium]
MYYYGYGANMSYILLMLITMALGLGSQAYIRSAYAKWSQVPSSGGHSGVDMARRMLERDGVHGVSFGHVPGRLTDHYDPRTNTLNLSDDNYTGGSVASVAVACHEAGHAIQTAHGYLPVQIRTAIVPVVNLTQQFWGILFFGGIMFNMMGLVRAAVMMFAFSVIFHLVTLPVEIDASRRAVAYLNQYGSEVDQQGAKQVLTAAALTYVAAALSSILQLLYLLSNTRRSRS